MSPVNQFIYQVAADENFDPEKYFKQHQNELKKEALPDTPSYIYRSHPLSNIQTKEGVIQRLLTKHLILPAAKEYAKQPAHYRQSLVRSIQHRYVKNGKQIRDPYVFKRLQILVNEMPVDVLLVGRKKNINNRRWILQSNPNLFSLEEMLETKGIRRRMKNLHANYLLFNYPGVGASAGSPNQAQMIATYQAMMKFLEDPNQVGAEEIIGWGTSIGGAVQGEAIKAHQFEKSVRYVFVKDQTFARFEGMAKELVQEVTNELTGKILGPIGNALFKNSQWTFDNLPGSEYLEEQKVPEVIIQNALVNHPSEPSEILGDGIISSDASLAKNLLTKKWYHKVFVGVSQEHATSYTLEEERRINEAVLQCLAATKAY